jgi:hypothetical protein
MMRKTWLVAGLVLALLALGPPARAAEPDSPAKKAGAKQKTPAKKKKAALKGPVVFTMEEVSAFEFGKDTPGRYPIPRGPYARCSATPSKEVKAYPKLKAQRPLYGAINFGGDPLDPKSGKTYYFVLDASGEEPRPATTKEPAKETTKDSDKEGAERADAQRRASRTSAMNPAAKFDRLYFDRNGDLDLTNDGVVQLARQSPFKTRRDADPFGPGSPILPQVFDALEVPFDFGPPWGEKPFRIVPWLASVARDQGLVMFIPATIRKGKIRFDGEEFVALLTQSRTITGRYDNPWVQLEVYPVATTSSAPRLLRPGSLGDFRWIDGQLATLSASPTGDKLTLQPYQGDTGILEVGPGGRTITDLGVTGTLVSKQGAVPLGEPTLVPPRTLPRQYIVPVGDYQPASLTIQYGRLRFACRPMTDYLPVASSKSSAFSVQVRKDKPCVLEFSGKPEVVFLGPPKDQTFTPGGQVSIRALLSEPWQKIMITGLWDTTKKTGELKYRMGGEEITVPEYARLDPQIVIRNAAGEEVAQGRMPFG